MKYVEAVMQVQKAHQYEMHLCPTGTCPHAWGDIEPALYVRHKDDRCPKCNAHRFVNAHGCIQPSRRCDVPLPWIKPAQLGFICNLGDEGMVPVQGLGHSSAAGGAEFL
jgi:hypothetical protein